jgi:RHS repeat-associated protein
MTTEPTSIVNGSVNAITGDFLEGSCDYMLSGPDPYVVGRNYTSSSSDRQTLSNGWRFYQGNNLATGWSFHHSYSLKVYQPEGINFTKSFKDDGSLARVKRLHGKHLAPTYDENPYTDLYVVEPSGGKILFTGDGWAEDFKIKLQGTGWTNVGTGEISGKTNLRNIRVSFHKRSDRFHVYSGDGTERIYARKGKQKSHAEPGKYNFHLRDYLITEERHPSGNHTYYEYNDDDDIRKITTRSRDDQQIMSWVRFHYQKDDKVVVDTSDGYQFSYYLDKAHTHEHLSMQLLKKVVRPGEPAQYFSYTDKTKHLDPMVEKKEYRNHYFIQNKYNSSGQVIAQKEPVGEDGKTVTTHTYSYHDNKTTVRDHDDNICRYFYNKEKRLTRIEKRNKDDKLLTAEEFLWGKVGSKEEGNLLARTLYDEKEHPIFCKVFDYDDHGNVHKEKLYGDFTGRTSGTIHLDKHGYPKESSDCDKKVITYNHTGKKNLLVDEKDALGNVTYYEYLDGTNLLSAKFMCDHNKQIKQRQFFSYDTAGNVIQEIVDDGSSKSVTELHGVTERHIKRIKPRLTTPHFGEPEVIEELYLDLQTNSEKLLRKTVNTFSNQGLVIKKELFDEHGDLHATFQFQYDNLGRMIYSKDPLGRQEHTAYDAFGRIQMKKGPRDDYETHFEYDVAGRLIAEEERHSSGLRLKTRYRYDPLGRKIATIDPQGNETKFAYDALDRMVKVEYPKMIDATGACVHPTKTYSYSSCGRRVKETDEKGFVTRKTFNSEGKPVREQFADGTEKKYIYDIEGRLIEEIHPNGMTTSYTYDLFNNITSCRQVKNGALLSEKKSVYNAFHLLHTSGPTHEEVHYTYSPSGRKILERSHDRTISYEYDSIGRIVHEKKWISDTQYIAKVFSYDALSRIVKEDLVDENGTLYQTKSMAYDLEGNVFEITESIQHRTAVHRAYYAPHAIPTKKTDPLGNTTCFSIDYFFKNELGQYVIKKTAIDPRGVKTEEILNACGKPVSISVFDPYGTLISKQKLFYDAALNNTRIEDLAIAPNSEKTIFTHISYGPMHRIESIIEGMNTPEQKTTAFSYNSLGQKETTTFADGSKLHHQYDEKGRLKRYFSSDQTIDYEYSYDPSDRPVAIYNHKTGKKTSRTYDPFGLVTEEIQENDLSTRYTYDRVGRLLDLIFQDSSKVSYSYTPAFLHSITRCSPQGKSLYNYTILERDLSGNILSAKLPYSAGTLSMQYDLLGRVTDYSHPKFSEYGNTYDSVGNLTASSSQDGQGELYHSYRYDFLSQLTLEHAQERNGLLSRFFSQGAKQEHTYQYDSLYNRIQKDNAIHQVNSLHQTLTDGHRTFSYDTNGRLTSIQGKTAARYSYDALDRLIKVETPSQTIEYSYDAFHRRMKKKTNSSTELYLYSGDNEIGAFSGSSSQLRILGEGLGAEIGASISFELNGSVYIPLHNSQGSVTTLLTPSGSTAELYRYSAFGQETIYTTGFTSTISPTSSVNNPWRFASKRTDPETSFVYFGRRYYDPSLGKWTTQDPLGIKEGPNLYTYCDNNPLTLIDEYGLFEQPQTGAKDTNNNRGFWDKVKNVFDKITGRDQRDFVIRQTCPPRIADKFGSKENQQQHSEIIRFYRDIPPNAKKLTIGSFIAGIGNTKEEAIEKAHGTFKPFLKDPNFIGYFVVINPPREPLVKCGELFLQHRFEAKMRQSRLFAREINRVYNRYSPLCKELEIININHSQGCMIAKIGFEIIHKENPDILNTVKHYGVGPAFVVTTKDFPLKSSVNIINVSDWVPFISDGKGILKACIFSSQEIRFVGSLRAVPMSSHHFYHRDYQEELQRSLGK